MIQTMKDVGIEIGREEGIEIGEEREAMKMVLNFSDSNVFCGYYI